jgi:hypothetical protein
MESLEFKDLAGLGTLAESLDKCRLEESWYKNTKTSAFESDKSRRDILNLNSGKRAAVVSNIYHEYQHADVVHKVVDSLTKAQLVAHGHIYDNGDTIKIQLLFDNISFIKDPAGKGKGIQPGAIFRNSYNKQNSVTGSGYFMRVICTNGMVMRQLIPELKFSERHTLSIVEKLPSAIESFTTGLLSRSKLIETTIKIASEVKVPFSNREQRLQTIVALVDHNKVGEMIEKNLTSLEPTKWDIYNAITQVLSHERVGETVKEKIEKVSEKILSPSYTVIPAVMVTA